ncbi:MFS transporter [Telmatospirillum sp.]|uniref:MFS transporter n=1 Tax=Telmatospirillum sp. TaxID=2079197 RepID=UPI00284C2295|nr:MFS transporter [Telmatospirillum sp.]MDR3436765.1 MFS transporter [Telmatospirillum sp.]
MEQSKAGLWTGPYVSLLCSTFVVYVGFQMLIPTLTTHITEINGTTLSASLVYSVAAAAALIARSAFGAVMDRSGRKPVLLVGATVLVFTNLLLFVVPYIPAICAIRFCQGFGWGMVSTALATTASDIIPERRMGEGIGYFALSIVFGTSLAVVVGIWLMNLFGFITMLGFSTAFFVVALILCQRMGAVPFHRNDRARVSDRSLWSTLFEKRAVLPAFLCFLHTVAFSGIVTFIMLFGAESGIDNVFVYFVGHLLAIMASRPIVGRIYDRMGHTAVIIPGVLSMMLGLVLLSYSHGTLLLFIASLFYGLGFGTVQPSLQAWAISRSPVDRRGAANGTFMSSLDLGTAIGAVLMGAVASMTSYAVMYRLSPVLLVVFLATYATALMREKKTGASQ